jgi:hypothetical protein
MTARIHENRIKGIVIAILFMTLMLKTIVSGAQTSQQRPDSTKGLQAVSAHDS